MYKNNDEIFYHQYTSYTLFPVYVEVLTHTIFPENTILCTVYMGSQLQFGMEEPDIRLDILQHDIDNIDN